MGSNATTFTAENAAKMAAKAAIARKANQAMRELELAELRRRADQPIIQPAAPDDYQERRKERVRAQLDALDKRMTAALRAEEIDAKLIDQLASASSRLNEQEAQLSMRAKPAPIKQAKGASNVPQMAEPSVD